MNLHSPKTIGRRTVLKAAAAAAMVAVAPRLMAASAKPEKLTFLCVTGGWGSVLYKEAIPAWEAATGVRVEVLQLANEPLSTRLRTEMLSGSRAVDLSMWSPAWAGWLSPHLCDLDKLLATVGATPTDTSWADLFEPAAKMARDSQGKRIGLPYRVISEVLYYQPELQKQLGIAKAPTTFAELLDAAQKITANGGDKRYGVGVLEKLSANIVGGFAPFLYSSGGRFYNEKTYEILINNDAAVQTLQFVVDLRNKHKVAPPEILTWATDEIIAAARQDRIGMAPIWGPWATQINGGPQEPGAWPTKGKWAYGKVPGAHAATDSRGTLSGWSIGIPQMSPNTEWAFKFLQHITNKQWFAKSVEGGNMPGTNQVLSDRALAEKYPWAAATAEALKNAVPMPSDNIWPTLENRLRTSLSEAYAGSKSPKVALDEAAQEWDRQIVRAKLRKS